MSKEAEYYLRQGQVQGSTEITKFTSESEPSATYTVFEGKTGRWFCDCPAGANGRHCKHLDWVQTWIQAGSPTPYVKKVDKKGNIIP